MPLLPFKISSDVLRLFGLAVTVLALGFLLGGTLVVFPPYVFVTLIVLPALFLMWCLPDIETNADRYARILMFGFIFANEVVPYYYTIIIPGLPYIAFRRVFLFAIVIITIFILSSSLTSRRRLAQRLEATKLIAYPLLGFVVIQILSIPASAHLADSIRIFVNIFTAWYIPLICMLLTARDGDEKIFVRLFVVCMIINCGFGGVEFFLKRPFLLSLMPASVQNQLFLDNPRMAALLVGSMRQGYYRASSTFAISLSWAEFAAMTAPFALYYVFTPVKRFDRAFGVVGFLAALLSVFFSASRGGYLGLLASTACFLFVWAYRRTKLTPESLTGGLIMFFYAIGTAMVMAAIVFVGRLHQVVIGGGAVQASNEGRQIQWSMGMPKILARPVGGYGPGSAADVVGFTGAGGLPTIDSYPLSLLVDYGVPGFLLFFTVILAAILACILRYLRSKGPDSNLVLTFGCSFVAFLVYRPFLSQTDNHSYMLIILAALLLRLSRGEAPQEAARHPLADYPVIRWQAPPWAQPS